MTLGLWLAIGAVVIVWLVYRAGQRSERQGVIRGLEAELTMHGNWTYRVWKLRVWTTKRSAAQIA